MMTNDLNPHVLLEMYGAELAQDFLFDLLEGVEEETYRAQIERAVSDLMDLIATDEKHQFLAPKETVTSTLDKLPPVFDKDCVQVWLFDDAFISFNKLIGHYHGYRKVNGKTFRLPTEEVRHYREYINNPLKLLEG
ncbi:hypothetical protein MTBPR1_70038 [Candidatus Terasakiella magnetica]|uniref:Uncharacterized protein n=1 Tax=Candidatus Terasakiella magnetica TaxID=1867952 RepID=A0A1C3RKI8_9PROT|nr:hypothetical protein [Candidatus Terasakiella magnetica]SCA57766.1 hypothetical protein MTBPR1_70038 [Candidatus Terasakiella magnetica]